MVAEDRFRHRAGADEAPVETTGELADIVLGAIPKRFHVRNIHPATRVFQALRIAVNDELAAIERSIADAYDLLAPGGLIMAISFHSLEDRIVKEKFRRLARGCFCGEEPRNCRCTEERAVNILTKKPLRPEIDEVERNSRARSARLRVCEKVPVPATPRGPTEYNRRIAIKYVVVIFSMSLFVILYVWQNIEIVQIGMENGRSGGAGAAARQRQ